MWLDHMGSTVLELASVAGGAVPTWSWQGWGTSLCWFANVVGHDPELTERVCRLLFGAAGLGMNIARYNIGASDVRRSPGDFRPGGAAPCLWQRKPPPQHKDRLQWELDEPQLAVLRCALRHGADTVQVFCNSPPFFLTSSGSSKGACCPLLGNLPGHHVAAYADFVQAVVAELPTVSGAPVHSICPFNEPSSMAWVEPGSRQEGCRMGWRGALAVLRAMGQQPALRSRLAAFDEFCVANSVLRLLCMPGRRRQALKLVTTHTYTSAAFRPGSWWAPWLSRLQDNGVTRWALRRLARASGKPLWVSEYGQATSHGQGLAAKIMHDLVTLRPNAWVYWQAVEDTGSQWGLLQVPFGRLQGEATEVGESSQFQVMRVFCKHLRPGCRLARLADNAVAAQGRDTLSVVATCRGQEAQRLSVRLPKGRVLGGVMDIFGADDASVHTYHLAASTLQGEVADLAVLRPGSVVGCTFALAAEPRQDLLAAALAE